MAINPSRELPQPKPKVSNMGRAAIGKTAPNTDLTFKTGSAMVHFLHMTDFRTYNGVRCKRGGRVHLEAVNQIHLQRLFTMLENVHSEHCPLSEIRTMKMRMLPKPTTAVPRMGTIQCTAYFAVQP